MDERNTDADWEDIGRHDAYWGVVTDERFHRDNLDDEARAAFFASGEACVARFFETIHAHLDPAFTPRRALDFGCGVGRLVLPLARRCGEVVGLDVAGSMLREAAANCRARGVQNLSFVTGDDELSAVAGTFDLITSYVVLQHIPCPRGRQLFQRLLELLADGGIGVVHITYSVAALDDYVSSGPCAWPPEPTVQPPPPDGFWHHLAGLRRAVRRRLAWVFRSRESEGRGDTAPCNGRPAERATDGTSLRMQMNPYLFNPLLHLLQQAGVRQLHLDFTDHGGYFGSVLFFRKQSGVSYRV